MAKKLIQTIAREKGITEDWFIGEMVKLGASFPTGKKLWDGAYESADEDAKLSNIRKAAQVLGVKASDLVV